MPGQAGGSHRMQFHVGHRQVMELSLSCQARFLSGEKLCPAQGPCADALRRASEFDEPVPVPGRQRHMFCPAFPHEPCTPTSPDASQRAPQLLHGIQQY